MPTKSPACKCTTKPTRLIASAVTVSESGAAIYSFQIPQSLAEDIRRNAVSQKQGKLFSQSPQKVDETKTNSAFGLPKEYIEKLRRQLIQGTGSVQALNMLPEKRPNESYRKKTEPELLVWLYQV